MASGFNAFNALIDSTMDFVKEHIANGGKPDVNVFWNYLGLLQKRGLSMGNDFAEFSARLFDAMIDYQKAAASTTGMENKLIEITKIMLDFIKDTKGTGNWNDFKRLLSDKQIELGQEYIQYVKRVIESVHSIYSRHMVVFF